MNNLNTTVNKEINLLVGAEIQESNLDEYKPNIVSDINLDDVRLYPIALTDKEIKALYETKAKIDRYSNMYTSQLVETKREKVFKLNINAIIDQIGGGSYTKIFEDGIFTFKVITATSLSGSINGPYFHKDNFNLLERKHYKYSLWVKLPKTGKWSIRQEGLDPEEYKDYIAGKWYHIKSDNISASNLPYTAFVFYLQNQTLDVGDEIQIRDFEFYRIDDDMIPVERDTDPKITKKAQIKGFEVNEIDYDRLTKRQNIIEKDGAKWVEVFYHNTNNNTEWFADEAEALHCTSQYKYSRLDCLEQYRQSDRKFEFLLEYPIEHPGEFNRWKQTDNPIKVQEIQTTSGSPANGYEAIHIDWSSKGWGGLLKSDSNNQYGLSTLLDGSTNHNNFFFSIGRYDTIGSTATNYNHVLPGPDTNPVTEVRLYARINDEQIKLGPTIINKYGAQWLEVFYHNNHSGTVLFTNKEEAMHTIGNKDKYSILDCLEQYRGKDNKFEFLLEYPTDIPEKYNRWKQQDNPAEVKEVLVESSTSTIIFPNAKGYEPIHIDWDGNDKNQQVWGGLLLSSRSETLIDGAIGNTVWFWSIGALGNWIDASTNNLGVPGPTFSGGHSVAIQNDIHLYVRIDNIDNRQQIAKLLKTGTIKTKEIKEI